ncbi:MAG: glycosyltransferase family 4 protein [Myxococcota bacterium]
MVNPGRDLEPMRILYFSHYFTPEGNAPARRVYEMCRRWVRSGHRVTVITCAPNVPGGVVYEGYANPWIHRETIEGIETIRVWTYLAANRGTLRRILNYLSYMVMAILAGLWREKPDVVIATSPQFFCGWAGVWVSRLRRVPFILEIRDLWPESIAAVGALRSPRLLALLERWERGMYRAATRIVTVGEGYRNQLRDRGVAVTRIAVVPNGVDRKAFAGAGNGADVRAEFGLGDAFVVSYVGTIGMGSGLDVVLRAAHRLRAESRDDVVFLLVGDGAVRGELETRAREEGLERVIFTGRRDKSRIPAYLAASDACLVHLTDTDLFRSVMPSKIFEAAAMAKPVILGVRGFAAELVAEAEAGICIEPENDGELVDAVKRLASDREAAAKMGESGRERIAARFDYDELAIRYLAIVVEIAQGGEE